MGAISMDLRVRIFEARQSGEKTAKVSERFCVSPAFVRRLMQRYREDGYLKPPGQGKKRGRKPAFTEHDLERLRDLATQRPDLTTTELRDQLGFSVQPLTVGRALRRLGFTYKKSAYGRWSKKGRRCRKHADAGTSRFGRLMPSD